MSAHARAREWLTSYFGNPIDVKAREAKLLDAYAAHILRNLADTYPDEYEIGSRLRAEAERLERGE